MIVGDGGARLQFEALARELGVDNVVSFLGWRRDIPGILASLDVVVLPTVLDFDPGSLVLTTFGRSNSGTVRGNPALADRFLNLFFRI